MTIKHIIISPETMLRQLIVALLKKQGISTIDIESFDVFPEIDSSIVIITDLTDDIETTKKLWADCTSKYPLNRCIFLINDDHELYPAIMNHCNKKQILAKPINPDRLYEAVKNIQIENAPSESTNIENTNKRNKFMKRALDISFEKMREEDSAPFGAVIVKDNKIIAEGWSKVISTKDPTAHAEIVAIRAAAKKLDHYYLSDCEIYTSSEPCPMCLSALYIAGIQKIYYANSQNDLEEFGFSAQTLYDEIAMPRDKRIIPYIRMMEDESIYALEEWKTNFGSDGYNV